MRRALWLVLILLWGGCLGPDEESTTSPTRTALPPGRGPWTPLPEPASTWAAKAAMPEARGEVACAAVGEKIYLFGGYAEGRTASPRLDVYDLATDGWSRGADSPVGMHHAQVVAYKGELYVPGGYTTSNFQGTNLFLKYTPSSNTWGILSFLPRARGAHAAAVAGDDLYVVGGRVASPGEVYTSVDIYNFTTAQWRSGPASGVAREHIAAALAGGELVAFGGRPGTLNVTESLKIGDTAWKTRPSMPTARSGIAAAAWEEEIVVFGGEMPGVYDEAEGYHVTSQTWRSHPSMPHARHGLCAATLSDGIHVLGGGDQQGFSLTTHHEVLVMERP